MNNSKKRNKILFKNSIYNYIAQFFYYIFNFLSLPLALNFLGNEKFGVFQTILTLISWASLANLGLGNGLRNKISEYLGKEKENELKSLIGSAFTLTAIISIILIILGCCYLWFFFDPKWLFKGLNISSNEVKYTFIISYVFFCLNLILNLFSSIAYGIHKSYIASFATTLQFTLYCFLLWLIIELKFEHLLIYIAFIYGLSLILSQLFPLISFYNNKLIWKPKFDSYKKYYKELFKISIGFFGLQISSVILFSSDNFIVSKLLGAVDVTAYSIASKIYFLIINIFSILLIQVWNSTTDAVARKDFEWIKVTVKRLIYFLVPIFFGTFFISIFLNPIVNLWTSKTFDYNILFRVLFCVYVVIHCINAIFVNILNGIGRLKIQMFAYAFAAIINFILSYILIVYLKIGLTGIVLSKIICVIITSLFCFYDYKKYINQKM